MVVNFLEQLCAAIPSTEGEIEDVLRKKTKPLRKLELRLTDRTKQSNDRCALRVVCSFVYINYLLTAGVSVLAHKFSRGEWVQASYLLVETMNYPLS